MANQFVKKLVAQKYKDILEIFDIYTSIVCLWGMYANKVSRVSSGCIPLPPLYQSFGGQMHLHTSKYEA
jgi:hypothetical protein